METVNTRIEIDTLGEVKVPADSYYGAFTVRASQNFPISGEVAPKSFLKAIAQVKLASLYANYELQDISDAQKQAIETAIQEFIKGKFDQYYIVDVYQAGAGTTYNMCFNEIIANRANELLGGKLGEYNFVHPNNHVNMSQSTNDVIPAVTRVAILNELPKLIEACDKLLSTLKQKVEIYKDLVKVGRTHLQDAVPVTFGQSFLSYHDAIAKSKDLVSELASRLTISGLGGTALGTGINTDPNYQALVTKHLSAIIGHQFTMANCNTEISNNMNSFMDFHAGLRSLATNLINLSSDLKLMVMGPLAGINEITIPAVQPGSSIMPGKINPSILECLDMVTFAVLGNDQALLHCSSRSHFELNIYCPLIMLKTLDSLKLLTNGIKILEVETISGLVVNVEHVQKTYLESLCDGTALAPYLGYNQTATVIKTALAEKRTLREQVLKDDLLTKEQLDQILTVERLTAPKAKLRKL